MAFAYVKKPYFRQQKAAHCAHAMAADIYRNFEKTEYAAKTVQKR
jgi:hypothetical protein